MKALEAKLVNGLFWFVVAAVFITNPIQSVGLVLDVGQAIGSFAGALMLGGTTEAAEVSR